MNKVYLIGNLTRDPELTETPSGVQVCHFSIAVGRNYNNADGEKITDFFNCTAWRGLAEVVGKYGKKGNKLAVCGSIQLRNYEDNQGVKRTAVDIVVQDVELLTPKANSDSFDEPEVPAATGKKKPVLQTLDDDSDIPF